MRMSLAVSRVWRPMRGLVEDVERADEARAERGGELDALGFAAGERGSEAVEGEVVEADLVEEVDALADLFEDLAGDFGLCRRELQIVEEGVRCGDGEGGDLADVLAADEDGAGFGAQALAAAVGAEGVAAVLVRKTRTWSLYFLRSRCGEEAADAGERCRRRLTMKLC